LPERLQLVHRQGRHIQPLFAGGLLHAAEPMPETGVRLSQSGLWIHA